MSIEIVTIYRGSCSNCGMVKTMEDHAMMTQWAERHSCGSGVVYSNVFESREDQDILISDLDKDYTQNEFGVNTATMDPREPSDQNWVNMRQYDEGTNLRAKRLQHPSHQPYIGGPK